METHFLIRIYEFLPDWQGKQENLCNLIFAYMYMSQCEAPRNCLHFAPMEIKTLNLMVMLPKSKAFTTWANPLGLKKKKDFFYIKGC
jgi:hypothetical protein